MTKPREPIAGILGKCVLAATACLALMVTSACLNNPDTPTPSNSPGSGQSASVANPVSGTQTARTEAEEAFLGALRAGGLSVAPAADTALEIGQGICRNLGEGMSDGIVTSRLKGIITALSENSTPPVSPEQAGKVLLGASRTHLCPS